MNFSELFGNAQWVTCDSGCTSPVIKGGFFIEEPKKAEITICGLGFFRLWINGREVSIVFAILWAYSDNDSSGLGINHSI